MRYTTLINNVKSIEWNLDLKEAYLFAWFYELPSWAEKVIIEHHVFYHASKNKAVNELPILTEKVDTMYRYYKKVESKGLVKIKKIDGKDYIALTEKGKTWNLNQIGRSSDHSEIYPNHVGNLSEPNSEIYPTNNIINTNKNYNNKTIGSNKNLKPSEPKKEKEIQSQPGGLFDEEMIPDLPSQILNYLNDKKPTSRNFENTRSNLSDIKARIKEKFKLDDFKLVIDYKVKEWNKPEMKKYIRPSTLFGKKFNEYLIQSENNQKSSDGSQNFKFAPSQKAEMK